MLKHIIILILILICFTDCQEKEYFDISNVKIPHQVDTRILLTNMNEIVYSSNISGDYQLYKLAGNQTELIHTDFKNVFNPFLIKNVIAGLYDDNGDEVNKVTSDEINMYLKSGSNISFIQSSAKGNFLIFRLKNDPHIYLLDLQKNEKLIMSSIKTNFNGVCFSKSEEFAVISLDDMLIHFDLVSRKSTYLSTKLSGEKLNPFIFKGYIFFVNNSKSDFYGIYRFDSSQKDNQSRLILMNNKDLRMPKFDGTHLFFIEIDKSEYILKSYNLQSENINQITNKGVVYNYDFIGEDTIALTYSDFYTPRCIKLYSKSSGLFSCFQCDSINLNLSYEFLKRNDRPAYVISPRENTSIKGAILFFHPGLHSDFSPRWDNIIMSLCANGFVILAPNFPMSSGYGKSYRNRSFEDAIINIEHWREYILNTYNLPIYFLASSSGNILMEAAISRNPEKIRAAASLFGLGNNNSINPIFPTLFILGENDPIVNFDIRKAELMNLKSFNRNITIISYPNEGHWFRNSENIRDAQRKIVAHFLKQL